MAGIGAEGTTTGATVEEGDRDEGAGLRGAVAIVAVAGGLGTETAAGGAGLTPVGTIGKSGEVVGGTTVSDGRSGSAGTTAMTSSGLKPSNSAF